MPSNTLKTTINRASYIPFYIQVIDSLTDYIESNNFPPGHQLPGEVELCRSFDVSRTVIHQALKELVYRGLIYRTKGRGTFVAEPKIHESLFQELTGFYQDMEAKGYQPKSEVLKQEKLPATKKVASYLDIDVGAPVIQIDRLRFVNQEPIVLVTTYFPFTLVPDLVEVDLSNQSLYVFLNNTYGIQIVRGKRFLEAVPANQREAGLLQVSVGSPLMCLDSISYLADDTPLEYYRAFHRGDRSRFEVNLIHVGQPSSFIHTVLDTSKA